MVTKIIMMELMISGNNAEEWNCQEHNADGDDHGDHNDDHEKEEDDYDDH